MTEISKEIEKTIERAKDASNQLLEGKSTINQIRVEYGLEPVEDEAFNELLVVQKKSTTLEQRVEELEKKIAVLEVQAQEQPNSDFANYLLQCTIQYQLMMSKSNDHPQF